ncbi:MAG: hypothetical protein MRJ68_12580 [Nitrospira sp.]|nr:hypothetical protein [Nitrospira sp.]
MKQLAKERSILDAMDDKRLFGSLFSGETWRSWRALLVALFGFPATPAQAKLIQRCTGRSVMPTSPASELFCIVGRRGGKSRIAALLAVYLACFRKYANLATGEVGTVMLIATDRRQARVLKRYIIGLLREVPMLEQMIVNETGDAIELSNRIVIEIHTASFRAVRGYTVVAALLDEIAFLPSEGSANPDSEILAALRPAMATVPGALLIAISSPYAQRGELYRAYRDHFGKDGDPVLVWQADTKTMNPLVPQVVIDNAYQQDEVVASAEYGAMFRRDVESFVRREAVDACTIPGRFEVPYVSTILYIAGFDAAGGSGSDEQTLAISHSEQRGGRWVHVLDFVTSVKPPFSPQQVVEDFCQILKTYRITRIFGDRYAGEWPREQFTKHGIEYRLTDKPKSDLYKELLPLINSGSVELLNHPKLLGQTCSLERRTARGGRDTIDHPPSGHDDLINAAAIALVTCARAVALPPLDLLGGTLQPRSADEIAKENDREYERRRQEGSEWLADKIQSGDGCYFPGD